MPVEPDKVRGAGLGVTTSAWDEDRVILYHLGIGAGDPPTDERELAYTYESRLVVLPTFATIPAFAPMLDIGGVDGLTFNPVMLLHGEHAIELNCPIPTAAEVTHDARIVDVFDKGKAALLIVEVQTRAKDGGLLFTNRASLFLRGEGGFGGPSGPTPENEAPDDAPDAVVESATLPQQALLYRLSGDKNPLHADPAFAAMAGFDRPILHGLCTYGIVGKSVVDRMFDGDPTGVAKMTARFSGVVYPGETVVTRMWDRGDRIVVDARTKERAVPVITHAAVYRT